jgi:hypothetical protein
MEGTNMTVEDAAPPHQGVAQVGSLQRVWAIFLVSYFVLVLGFESLRGVRLENMGLIDTIPSGALQGLWINGLLMGGVFFGAIWWLFSLLEKGWGWVRVVFLSIASLAILGSLLQLVGLVQVPETLLPVLPEPSEEAKEYYMKNPHFLEISLNIHAFGRGLALFKQALFALANVGLGAWFWKVLMQPSVVEMLREAKEARATAKAERAIAKAVKG